jgi:hypothetical protein
MRAFMTNQETGFAGLQKDFTSCRFGLRHGVLSEWTLLLTTGIAAVHLWSYIVGVRLFGLLPFVADSLHAEADREPH